MTEANQKKHSRNGAVSVNLPDPEVSAKPKRRVFTAKYKLRILREADACEYGELGALLRREGLYSSHLSTWRRQRDAGELAGLSGRKRGRKPTRDQRRIAELKRDNEQLRERLEQAETIIAVQKKLSQLLKTLPENKGESSS